MDAWLVLAVESPQVVYHWRLQAEQRMRELGRGALTDVQVWGYARMRACCAWLFLLLGGCTKVAG
jgi:pantothenate kinase-related protein Tda10